MRRSPIGERLVQTNKPKPINTALPPGADLQSEQR